MVALDVIILAAGRSSRLGEAKALIDLGGNSLISCLVARLQKLTNVAITAVTNADLLADIMIQCPSIHVVLNPDPEKGRTGSLRCALESILERNGRLPNRLLLVPVDRPGWSIEIVRLLLESDVSCCPSWDDRGGHPLLLVGDDIKSVYLSSADVPLSSLIQRKTIRVNFPFLHLNIDRQEDVNKLLLASKEDWF
tara:strand:- start:47 stop:631 length:585 start_codon:yes stop_codon:yes gene_type:complete